jgi:hypothetical protein
MARRGGDVEHRHQEVYPMQTLRASAVAAPFVILAVVVALLGVLIR